MKFFLRINKSEIIEFPSNMGFDDIDQLTNLSTFTGIFEGPNKLFDILKKLKIIQNDMTLKSIDIVARDEETDEFLNFSNRVLYAEAIRYLDYNNILGFFVCEKKDYNLIESLITDYQNMLTKQYQEKKESLASINKGNYSFKSKAAKNYVIGKIETEANNIMEDLINTDRLILLCDRLAAGNKDLQLEKKYIERIHKFINYRLYTKKDGHTEINEAGLLALAMDIYDCGKAGIMDYVPQIPPKLHKKMEYYKSLINYYVESANLPRFYRSKDNSTEDPDNFMFLDEDDYHSLLNDAFNSPSAHESVENQILHLRMKKGNRL